MSSPLPENPYAILGVSKDAQLPEIRSAHRKLVLKCHPDKVQDPTLKAEKQNEFQRVQQAYEILSNENEREKYDQQIRAAELRAELRKQAGAQSKPNSSAPRASRNTGPEFEVYTSPRASHRSSPTAGGPTTFTKVYWSTRSHSDEERRNGPRVYDAEPRSEPRVPPARRESSFVERETRPSKRESEREREREKDRDRERERERKKKVDREVKAQKEEKELRREQKKAREKQMAKERSRQTEEKRRYMTPEEDVPPPRAKKEPSSSRKYEPRDLSMERERDLGYEDFGVDAKSRFHEEYAESYINAARVSAGGAPRRSKTYHGRTPYVPSPPPPHGVASAYPSPDEDEPRRSSASARRRGSAEAAKLPREKSYTKPSRERLDEEPIPVDARASAGFQKSMSSAAAATGLSGSPPRPLPRTNTMPTEATFSRPPHHVTRSKTFTEGASPRGRTRSKMEPQVEIESEDEDVYEQARDRDRRARDRDSREVRDARDRKHRSSKKHRSPDRYREEPRAATTHTYSLNEDGGVPRTKYAHSYTRRLDPDSSELYESYGTGARYVERPPLGVRESSYSSSYGTPPMTKFPKVRTTKIDDVQYSKYPAAY